MISPSSALRRLCLYSRLASTLCASTATVALTLAPSHASTGGGVAANLAPASSQATAPTLTVTDSDGATTTGTASVMVAPKVSSMALLAGDLNGLGNVDAVGALARFSDPGGTVPV